MRVLNDRGVMVYLGRESYLTTAENDPNGLRVVVNGKTAQFTNDEGQGAEQTPILLNSGQKYGIKTLGFTPNVFLDFQ